MALFPGFFRKGWYVPAGLSAAALFYNPELLLHSVKPQYMLAVSAGSVGFLALALMPFDFRRLAGAVASMKREAQLALGGFFCIAAGHFFLNGRYPFDALGESLVWILLPLAAYVYYDAFRFFLPRALALLGLWDLAVSGIQYHSGAMIFGIAGNTNWNAVLLLVSLPFLAWHLSGLLRRFRFPALASLPAAGAVLGYGLWIFAACASRGAAVALGLTGLIFLAMHLTSRGQRYLRYALLAVLLLGTLYLIGPGSGFARRIAEQEDRLVFYRATLGLIAENPVFGVGGVSFENEFVRFKPEDYFTRMQNAPRTNHPHNDVLFMMASFGILGWLAWAWLVLYPLYGIFRGGAGRLSGERKLLLFAFLCLLFHAQLDLIFVAWPMNLIALWLLGLFWRDAFREEQVSAGLRHPAICRMIACTAGIVILFWTALSVARSAYASSTANAIHDPAMRVSEKLERISRSLRFAPHEYKPNYALMIAAGKLGAPELALAAADALIGSYIENYAHVYGYRGGALVKLGRYDEAFEAYLKEAENYPLSMIPVYNLASISKLTGHPERIPKIEEELFRRMKIQNVTPAQIPLILKNPDYDRAPWDIPVKYGGSGGYPKKR